jgi:hypothetical protein
MGPDGQAQGVDGPQGSVVGKRGLLGHPTHRQLQFEQLEDAQPLLGGQRAALQPTSAEIVEGKAATGTAPPSVSQAIEPAMTAVRTNSLLVFPAKSQQVFPRTGFGPNQGFIRAEVHRSFIAFGPKLKQSPKVNPVEMFFNYYCLFLIEQTHIRDKQDHRLLEQLPGT